jgi:hypothetical protein
MAITAKLDKWGNEIWSRDDWHKANQEQGFATKFKSLEQIIEAELDAEEAQRQCTNAPIAGTPAAAKTTPAAPSPTKTRATAFTSQTEPDATSSEKRTDMAATPQVIDTTPLEQQFDSQRRDFDAMRQELQEIRPVDIKANMMGRSAAQMAAEADTRAKDFINAFDEAFSPILDSANATVKRLREFRGSTLESALQVRTLARGISSQYQLALDYRQQEERRELERKQRETAEHERAEEVARLQALADKQAVEAAKFGGVGSQADEAEAEAAKLALEAAEAARAPIVPSAVPLATVSQGRVAGISGVKVFLRTIPGHAAAVFLKWAAGQPISVTIPREKRNVAILMLGGIEITVNFAGLRKSSAAIPGVDVTETFDSRNLRK